MEKQLTKIQTSRFGEVEVDNSLLFNFASPIIGYPNHKEFALVDYRPDSPFKWLQSVQDKELAFPVTLCSYFNIDYQFELSDEDADTLGIKTADEILALNIVTIPQINPHGATINLLAPVVINTSNNKAMQIILKDAVKFPVRHPLFDKKDDTKAQTTADNEKGSEGDK